MKGFSTQANFVFIIAVLFAYPHAVLANEGEGAGI